MNQEREIKKLKEQVQALVKAAKRVLSDIDDDGVAERHDMAVLALRTAVLAVEKN